MNKGLLLAVALGIATASVPARAWAQRDDDEETEVLVQDAKHSIAEKDYQRAAELLDKALGVNPRRIDLYVLRASVHGVLGEHDKAIALLEKAQRLDPQNQSVQGALGIQLVEGGQPDKGVPILEQIVAKAPTRYDAEVVLGHYYVSQAMWPRAVTAFDAYFASRPSELAREDRLHEIDWAEANLRSGDPKTAQKLYQKVLDENKDSEAARLGVVWAAAAIDCRQAMPLFDGITDLENKYAEVSLVRGRCALLLGRNDEALAAAERYRKAEKAGAGAAAGWELLGDVQTAKKNLGAAEVSFQSALDADPKNKVYGFKLGKTERLLGKTEAAAEQLRATGAPKDYEDDWTIEYGEALYTLGQADELRQHIATWADAHPTSATGQFLYGAALYALGDGANAVPHLEKANAGGEARAKAPLIDALDAQAVAAITAASPDLPGAEKLLEQAAGVGDDVLVWRNLGSVYLAENDDKDARTVLKKAVDAARPDDPVALHLYARALQAGKQYDDAKAAYLRAIKAYGKDRRAVAAYQDYANEEVAAGRGDAAVDALDTAIDLATDNDQKTALAKELVDAARDAGTDAMRAGKFNVAVKVLKSAEKRAVGADADMVRCDLALASTGAGNHDAALDDLYKLQKSKAACPFVAPADELAVPILIAWNEGATLRKAKGALDRLDKIRTRARGVAEPLTRTAAKDIALRAASEAYDGGNLKKAEVFLDDAKLYDKKSPELAHNLAVVQLEGGDLDAAISALDDIKDQVPEAYINLGIAYDRKHDAGKALEYWKKAAALGVHFAPLKDWIDAKIRFWGDTP